METGDVCSDQPSEKGERGESEPRIATAMSPTRTGRDSVAAATTAAKRQAAPTVRLECPERSSCPNEAKYARTAWEAAHVAAKHAMVPAHVCGHSTRTLKDIEGLDSISNPLSA
jgi:hypothetical protein